MQTPDLRKPFILLLGLVLLFLGPVGPGSAGTIDPALEQVLQSLDPQDEVPVIVKAVDKAQLAQVRDRDKRARRSRIVKALRDKADMSHRHIRAFSMQRGVTKMRSLWIINGTALRARGDVIRELATLPQVEIVTLDGVLPVPVTSSGAPAAPAWNISAIHVPELWDLGHTGEGVVLASMDSGVDVSHPELQGRWRGGTNSWFDPYGEHASPTDVDGHGTQAMGIMVGGDAGGSAIGVAPGAQWIAVKIFNDAGTASYSAIHQGFQWLLDPDSDPETNDTPDVVNNSWGLLDPTHACITEFQQDVQTLKTAGVAVTFSAGNDGPGPATSLSPANYPESFAVGAVDQTGTIMESSSRGPSACGGDIFPQVVAPGADILTTDLNLGIPDAYTTVSGTSFAAPHQSGVMALLISAFPALEPSVLEAALADSSTDLGLLGPDNEYGRGLINALGAYNTLYDLVPPASPVLSASGAPGTPILLSWTAGNPGNAIGFRIERATGAGGAFAAIGTTAEDVTSFTDTTTTAGRKYRYRVIAFNPVGETTSNTVTIVPGLPAAPTNLVATAVNPEKIGLTWTDNAEDERGMTIQRAMNADFAGTTLTTIRLNAVDRTSYNNTGLTPKTTYYYRVRTHNASGPSAWSNTASAKTPNSRPAAPSDLAGSAVRIAGNTTKDKVTLTWKDTATNERGFTLQRALDPGFTKSRRTYALGTDVTTFRQEVSRARNFYYRVRAINAVGNSAWSDAVFITTP